MANKKVKFTLTAVDKTKAAFDKVTKGLKGVGSVAGGVTKGVAKVGLAATGAATALAALVKVNVDFMDKLGKTANKLGIEVEFLQAMRFAAEQTGVKVEALDMGLQRFIRRAAEAAKGTGESKRAFEQLGIQLKDNDGNLRDVRDILLDVADGLENTKDSGERVRLAFKFFDSEGVSLVSTLKEGADGLRAFEQQAENLGIIISKQSIAKAEMFANSLNVLKKQFTALTANISAAFIPILEDVAATLSTMLTDMKDDETPENFGKNLAINILEAFKNITLGINKFFNDIKKEFLLLADTAVGRKIFGDFLSESEKAQLGVIRLNREIEAIQKNGFIKKGWGTMQIFAADTSEALAEVSRLNKEIAKIDQNILPDESGQKILTFFDNLISKTRDYKLELKGGDEEDDVTGGISEKVAAFRDGLGATEDAISNLAINTTKKFEDTLVEGLKNGKLAFKDFADYAIEQIIRIALQEAILKPFTGGVESFFQGIFGKKALGGSVNAGKPYMVGESGRELFIPNQSGQIVSNQDLKQMGTTQAAPTVNFNISTVDAAGFDQLLASRKGLITSIINNAMNNQGKMGVV
nr:Phage-related minor tail protein [uncultured Mediterranean phage uvMED]